MKVLKYIARIVLVLILLVLLAVFYGFQIEPHMLTVKKYELNQENNISGGSFRLVQLSDIEYSKSYSEKDLRRAVNKVNELSPDVVVFTGDLFSNFARYHPIEDVISMLGSIDAVYGKYAVWGNKDYGGGAMREYQALMEDAGFQVLKNEGIRIELKDGKAVYIGGLDDGRFGRPDVEQALHALTEPVEYSILLMHEPDLTDLIGGGQVDLALAGHSHGGQVKLPVFEEMLQKAIGWDSRYVSGFYELDNAAGTELYVNSGMGTSRLPVRFMVPPQIALFEIGF